MSSIIVSRKDLCIFFDKNYVCKLSGSLAPQYVSSKVHFSNKRRLHTRVKLSDILVAPIVTVLSEENYHLLRSEELPGCYNSSGKALQVCRYVESVWDKDNLQTLYQINRSYPFKNLKTLPLIITIKFLKTQYDI